MQVSCAGGGREAYLFYGISNLHEIVDKETERVSRDVRLGEGKHFDLRAHP